MKSTSERSQRLQQFVATAQQMSEIESRLFDAGMPVAALMEKVGGLLTQQIQLHYPQSSYQRVGVVVGPGHNGGDALVVARELQLQGYEVRFYQPLSKLKELTAHHAQFATHLGIWRCQQLADLKDCDLLIDGLFGFGLTRSLEGELAALVDQINQWPQPIVSLDLPSGLHTDTGAVLGCAIRATHTFCLGLWKLAFLQDQALEYLGQAKLIDFGIPLSDIEAVLQTEPQLQRITPEAAIAPLSRPRSPTTYKYKQGHLLLICGSRQYMGAALLTGLGARASGVGMVSIAVPESLKLLIAERLPEALTIGCPETASGAIARFPDETDLSQYTAIACGPGLTQKADGIMQQVLNSDQPLVLDADGLNVLAQQDTIPTLKQRQAATVLTPHPGEFKRLFPDLAENKGDRVAAVRQAAQQSGAIVLYKGARTLIGAPSGIVWINPDSSPALARGGSGDVLTGLLGGLMAQAAMTQTEFATIVSSGVWWHAQAAILAAQTRTERGVDPATLAEHLIPTLKSRLAD